MLLINRVRAAIEKLTGQQPAAKIMQGVRGIGLRIQIDHGNSFAALVEIECQMHEGCRFADAAFLISCNQCFHK